MARNASRARARKGEAQELLNGNNLKGIKNNPHIYHYIYISLYIYIHIIIIYIYMYVCMYSITAYPLKNPQRWLVINPHCWKVPSPCIVCNVAPPLLLVCRRASQARRDSFPCCLFVGLLLTAGDHRVSAVLRPCARLWNLREGLCSFELYPL